MNEQMAVNALADASTARAATQPSVPRATTGEHDTTTHLMPQNYHNFVSVDLLLQSRAITATSNSPQRHNKRRWQRRKGAARCQQRRREHRRVYAGNGQRATAAIGGEHGRLDPAGRQVKFYTNRPSLNTAFFLFCETIKSDRISSVG